MYTNLNEFLFRYLVIVHCMIFLNLFLYTFVQLKLKISKYCSSWHLKTVFLFFYIIPLVQVIASVARIFSSYTPTFKISNALISYINFIWSPMLTILILWFFINHLTSSSELVKYDIKYIFKNTDWNYNFLFLLIGVFSSMVYTTFLYNYDTTGLYHLLSFSGICFIMLLLRLYYNLFIFKYVLYWFFGTWLYFLYMI